MSGSAKGAVAHAAINLATSAVGFDRHRYGSRRDPVLTFVTDRFREVKIRPVFANSGPGSRDGS